MNKIQNPVRIGHWASSILPKFSSGKHPNFDYTTTKITKQVIGRVQVSVSLTWGYAFPHCIRILRRISCGINTLNHFEKAIVGIVNVIVKHTFKEYQQAHHSTIRLIGVKL